MKPFQSQVTQTEDSPNIIPVNLANELTIFAEATAMPDPDDRRGYLDRICGNNVALRQRVEERIAAQEVASLLQSASRIPEDALESAFEEEAEAHTSGIRAPSGIGNSGIGKNERLGTSQVAPSGGAPTLALTAEQMATLLANRPTNTLPWLLAVVFAALAGASAVFYFQEKDARVHAEDLAKRTNQIEHIEVAAHRE